MPCVCRVVCHALWPHTRHTQGIPLRIHADDEEPHPGRECSSKFCTEVETGRCQGVFCINALLCLSQRQAASSPCRCTPPGKLLMLISLNVVALKSCCANQSSSWINWS